MKAQRGGFVMGLIVGLLLGLALALAVALYVTKVPVPFVNKVPQRGPEQNAAEIERNKNWDPNAPLSSKAPPRAGAPAGSAPVPPGAPPGPQAAPPKAAAVEPAPPQGQAAAPAKSTKPGVDPFIYFVQVGAFAKPEDAEQQRAKLAMLGFSAKVSEREQSGRPMYRVRLGPYQMRDEAESAQTKLQSGGEDAALVRVER